jgi:methylamine dehydrogenase accessory protein MauD
MDSLLIAHGALWVLVAILALLLVVLARQIGALHARVAPAGALAVNSVIQIGQAAPELRVTTLNGSSVVVGADGGGRSQLLMFVAPDCPISRSLVPVLGTLARAEPWADVLLVSDGDDEDAHRQFSAVPELAGFDYALSEPLGRAYGVSKLPYAVLIDEAGRIAAMGIVNSREHLESLFEAKERGVASIQEFMASSELFYRADSEPS